MSNWFKKKSAVPSGPDFSDVDSQEKAEARVQSGELAKLLLLSVEFGGTEDPRNIVYVPRAFITIKNDIDRNIIKPLVEAGKVSEYQATPEYEGKSFVPIAIKIVARNPETYVNYINIWGKALAGAS